MQQRLMGLCFLLALIASSAVNAKITISGVVVDGKGEPVGQCDVFFNKEEWITDESPHATCNEKGEYSIDIEPGFYNSIYVCDEEKYGKTKLEFWGWNVTFEESQSLNVAFDTIEVYSLSTWASNGGSNSLFAAFRPMLLPEADKDDFYTLTEAHYYEKQVQGKVLNIIDIAPAITQDSIVGTIDGEPIALLDYFWTYEKLNSCQNFPETLDKKHGCYQPMIVAQFKRPKLSEGRHTLKVRVIDDVSKQIGEGITHFISNRAGLGF